MTREPRRRLCKLLLIRRLQRALLLLGAHRWWIAAALLWAMGSFALQEWTLNPSYLPDPWFWRLARVGRAALALSMAAALLLSLPRSGLLVALGLHVLFALIVATYEQELGRPLSLSTIMGQATEGMAAADAALAVLPWPLAFAALLCAAGVALAAERARRVDPLRDAGALAKGRYWLAAHLAMVLLASFAYPLSNFRLTGTTARLGILYGYGWTWLGEYIYLHDDVLLARATAAGQKRTDRLSDALPPIEIGCHLIIVQVEGLGIELLRTRISGTWVTPFIDSLIESSLLLDVASPRVNGSGDADFTMITAAPPSPDVMTYKIPGYPYGETLAMLASGAGYHVSFLHGATGEFYQRRAALEQLGFDALFFREELVAAGVHATHRWGVQDGPVFGFAARDVSDNHRAASAQFIVTLSSHSPFDLVPPRLQSPVPRPRTMADNYHNSMHYVDAALAAYYTTMPSGTLLVVYGDHEVFGRKQVPVVFHRKGDSLAGLQNSVAHFARGELQLTDVASYLHQRLRSADTSLCRE